MTQDKIGLTNRIKEYINDHPRMHNPLILNLDDMEACAFSCHCTTYEVMLVVQLGSL